MVNPEHRARPRRRRRGERRDRRHRGEAAGSATRWRGEAAERDARRERSSRFDDLAKASPPPAKRPRLLSEIGEVRGSLWRVEHLDIKEHAAAVPGGAGAAAPTPSSSSIPTAPRGNRDGQILAPEAAPAHGGAGGTALSSAPAAPPTTYGVFLVRETSLPAPPPLPSTSRQEPPRRDTKAPVCFAAAVPPPQAAPPTKRKTIPAAQPPPARANHAGAPMIPLPPPQPEGESTRAKSLKRRFAGLITKCQKVLDDRFLKDLKSGRAPPPEPEVVVAVDEEARRRSAELNAERERAREELRAAEEVAQLAGLFVQYARAEQLRALGIDEAMELVVSPERPRDAHGAPVLSPAHPCCPVEKLGYFLKVF
ncbi:hypothetical protein ACP70R_029324 [Stipagrostis hirtigluma subsp. patula]